MLNKDALGANVRRPLMVLLACLFCLPQTSVADSEAVTELLETALACRLAEEALATMSVEPLYQKVDGNCEAATPADSATEWFDDAVCINPVTFEPLSMKAYCSQASNRATLGNGVNISDGSWTLSPGNRLNLGARTLKGLAQPYMQRTVFRRVATQGGTCELEMRVYKKHPSSSGQRTMLALHGGSWTSRSFGYLGLELSIPHMIDNGFTVYAPFYRLLDNTDSNAACHNAKFDEIVDDASAALDWVLDNAATYGSRGVPVVFGQSAGAHLALSLSVNRSTDVAGSVLFYPPTDFTDFLQRVKSGAYTNAAGLSILERVVGMPAAQAELSLPVVAKNSFPARIATEGGDWPPMFIVQGAADALVEPRQSVRLCDALAGRQILGSDQQIMAVTDLREVSGCGQASNGVSSVLHLLQRGDHALDVCINENVSNLCPAGGVASSQLVSQSVAEAMAFAGLASEQADDDTGEGLIAIKRKSGGSLLFLPLLLLLIFRIREKNNRRDCMNSPG